MLCRPRRLVAPTAVLLACILVSVYLRAWINFEPPPVLVAEFGQQQFEVPTGCPGELNTKHLRYFKAGTVSPEHFVWAARIEKFLDFFGLYGIWEKLNLRGYPYFSLPTPYTIRYLLPLDEPVALASFSLKLAGKPHSETDLTPNGEFALACIANDGKEITFRPMGRRIRLEKGYYEPMIFGLPAKCLHGRDATIVLRLSNYEDLPILAEARTASAKLAEPSIEATEVVGFVDRELYQPGETISFHMSGAGELADLDISRVGASTALEQVFVRTGLPLQVHRYAHMAGRDGVDWPVSLRVEVPMSWRPGYYVATLSSNGKQHYIYFLVGSPPGRSTPRVALLASTNTWQAYNSWGGSSFYDSKIGNCLGEQRGSRVSFRRPITARPPSLIARTNATHLEDGELLLAHWFEKSGVSYDMLADRIVDAEPARLESYHVLVLTSHPEYWSDRMRAALQRFLMRGGSLIYLGGDALYNRVTIQGDSMEGYNFPRLHDDDGRIGGWYWLLGYQQSEVLGVQYDAVGYNQYSPYQVLAPTHWAFSGTHLRVGQTFGVGVALDGKPIFASGLETDKTTAWTPPNSVVLARGTGPGGAEMVIYDHPGGGLVYSAGSVAYATTLIQDPAQGKILKNVLTEAMRRSRK